MTKTNKKTIRALERGIAVLDIINKIGPTSLKSIYEESTLPRPTLLRILHTLEQTGLIRRGLGDGLYRPTFKLEKMAINRHDETDLLAEIAAPTINSLSEHISWPSDLAVLSKEGPFMVLKETSRPNSPFILNIDKIGHKVSLTLSAVGRAYLAYSSPEKINQLIPNTDLIKLKPCLEEIKKQGYALRDPRFGGGTDPLRSQYDDGLDALAVALPHNGEVLGCINIAWLRKAVTLDNIKSNYLKPLQIAAREIVKKYIATSNDNQHKL